MPKYKRESKQTSLISKLSEPCKQVLYFVTDFFKLFVSNMRQSLKRWDPWFGWIGSSASALSSFVSTIKLTPVIFSSLTVLSTIPLFHIILPSVIFEPIIFTPIVIGIAAITAYKTYKDAIDRDSLDNKIEVNEEKIVVLERENTSLKRRLTVLETHFKTFKSQEEKLSFKTPKRLHFKSTLNQDSIAPSAAADMVLTKRKSASRVVH